MNEHNTQPLTAEQVELNEGFATEQHEQSQKAWNDLINHPLVKAFREAAQPKPHVHGPFTFLLNQNHNALRGCQSCGAAWVGSMAGAASDLCWHPVAEPDEEEEE